MPSAEHRKAGFAVIEREPGRKGEVVARVLAKDPPPLLTQTSRSVHAHVGAMTSNRKTDAQKQLRRNLSSGNFEAL